MLVRPDLSATATTVDGPPPAGPETAELRNATSAISGAEIYLIGDDGAAACFVVGVAGLDDC